MSNFLNLSVVAVLVVASAMHMQNSHGEEPATSQPIDFRVVDDTLPDIDAPIRITRGDTVTLRITADRRTDIHIHGYELKALIEPGKTTEISFVARATGRFPISTHDPDGAHVTLQYLEVHPR